jgi:hypothetical protein
VRDRQRRHTKRQPQRQNRQLQQIPHRSPPESVIVLVFPDPCADGTTAGKADAASLSTHNPILDGREYLA